MQIVVNGVPGEAYTSEVRLFGIRHEGRIEMLRAPLGGADLSGYIVVDGAPNIAVETSQTQICITGVEHGKRYHFKVRSGLPSADNEHLAKDVDLESVSGDLRIKGALATNGEVEASSVSGDVQLEFAGVPDADFDLQAFSGDLHSCLGNAQPVREKYGPGSKLNFRSGKGGGRVRVDTKSGDISVCTAH